MNVVANFIHRVVAFTRWKSINNSWHDEVSLSLLIIYNGCMIGHLMKQYFNQANPGQPSGDTYSKLLPWACVVPFVLECQGFPHFSQVLTHFIYLKDMCSILAGTKPQKHSLFNRHGPICQLDTSCNKQCLRHVHCCFFTGFPIFPPFYLRAIHIAWTQLFASILKEQDQAHGVP